MTTTIIIIILLVVIALLYSSLKKNHSVTNYEGNIKPKIMVSINDDEYRETKSDNSPKNWREKSNDRERRMIRKHKIWAVLRYMVTYRDLVHAADFYSFKKNLADHEHAKGELRKLHPDNYSFDAAIRFCQMENYYGTCDYQLTDNDVKFILNWQTNSIDIHNTLKNVLASYKEHWDSVLSSYVRPSARTKRLQYLVENLEEMMDLPDIQEYPDILQEMKELQSQYQLLLNERHQ